MSNSFDSKQIINEGNGKILPNNAFDLMKHIRENENKGNNSMRAQVHLLKQELQREMIERKLMEVEDYTYTLEGKRREQAYEDRLHMEAEDMHSAQIEKAIRDLKKLDFRDKIRRDAEERLKQEELDRQRKLEAAERRRQAVVERIKKKKEEEEAAIRRAEEARLQEIAEKERAIQLAAERLRSDRSHMEMEDELSSLAEQWFKEYLEKLQWKKQEEDRLAAWEEEQRKKDELEAQRRRERLAEIEAKKAKLAELRKAQMITNSSQSTSIHKEELRLKDVQQAREEAIKLGKQMRIQNKAKYVSKKRKEEPLAEVCLDNLGENSQQQVRRNSLRKSFDIPPAVTSTRRPSIQEEVAEIDLNLIKKIETTTTESELYQMQKVLMAEKRSLRIEIMSNSTHQENKLDSNTGIPGSQGKNAERQIRVNEIAAIEKYIQSRMESLISSKDKSKENTSDNPQFIQPTKSVENEILGGKGIEAVDIDVSQQRRKSVNENDLGLYNNIERCLQEANEIVLKYGIIDILSTDKNTTPRTSTDQSVFDYAGILRRSHLLKMQMTEQLTKIRVEDDLVGYREKITNCVQKLSLFIEKHQEVTPQKQPQVLKSNLTPEVLQRINSFTSIDAPNSPPKTKPPKKVIHNEEDSTGKDVENHQSENDLSEATTAIGMKLLQLVRHDDQKKEIIAVTTNENQDAITPRRKLGIAENKEEKISRHVVSLGEEPYVVSPRTRVSPRLYPLNETASPVKPSMRPTSGNLNIMPESKAPQSDEIIKMSLPSEKKPPVKPRIHPTESSNTISSPVLISAQTKKVAGHVAIEITDLEHQLPSRRNSERTLKSCDSTSSMLSTGISDNVDGSWWNNSTDNDEHKHSTKKKSFKIQIAPKTASLTIDNGNDDDDWWNQAGVTNSNEPQSFREQEETSEEFDYNSIPGWTECLHTTMATAAHHAAFYGYIQVLEYLSYYFDLFQMDKNGRTPLFYASLRNNLDCVLLLVSIDPYWIEVGDYRGDTAIHAAAISDGDDVLSFLITCEINPSIANYEGLTPVHLCKSPKSLLALYNANATMYCVDNNSRMPLWYRSKDGNCEAVDLLCRLMPINYIIWQDSDGNTPLHIACLNGHEEIVEILCQWYTQFSDYYITNKKNYSIVHVAKTSAILKKLYEYGIDLWVPDTKFRYPLFINSFQGKVDCVALLIDIAIYRNQLHLLSAKDFQGDTALHAACLTGNIQCVSLLLYYIRDSFNNQGLLAYQLAEKAGYHDIAKYVYHIEQRKLLGESSYDIFQCTFDELTSITLYYGTRWCKLYDVYNDEIYYYDRVLQISQWHRPLDYDEKKEDEKLNDKIRSILKTFYLTYNPEKLGNINDIMSAFKNKHQELFLQLAERYNVEDLTIFSLE